MEHPIEHQENGSRGAFHIERDGQRIAEMTYSRSNPELVVVDHTYVDPSLRGQGVARRLLDAAVAWARKTGTKLGATCSYAVVQFARDKSLADVVG